MARAASEAHLHQSRNPPGRRRPGSRRMSFVERTGLDRFNPAQGGVRGMRVIAGGLLVAMACLFLFARMRERSEENTSELQSLMRISYAVFCLKSKKSINYILNDKYAYLF